jgi:23S rRNA (uracil1939-C5)-methyltransferase
MSNFPLTIESMDLEAQGIAHRSDGKVVFVEGALPFEVVSANIHRKKNNWEQGSLLQIHHESSQRVKPPCPNFGLQAGACGGCKMQHLNVWAQVAVKQRVLEDNLWHLGKVKPLQILRPIQGPDWGYRYRARLSVRYVIKKSKALIGFHERKSRYVADMESCAVLPPHVSALLLPLRDLIGGLDAKDSCPQIEVACGDTVTALILRHLLPLSAADTLGLQQFAHDHHVQWWLQPKGPDSVHPLTLADGAEAESLFYGLPQFGLSMHFRPTDFTQVNPHINQVLVSKAMGLLDIQPPERLIDWFCGLGNFTLPMATLARHVIGVEGSQSLLDWAQKNKDLNSRYALNGSHAQPLCDVEFRSSNLFEMGTEDLASFGHADKWLIDPPREGAFALIKALAALKADPSAQWQAPVRIVYVSCNPATLARDADLLVNTAGYECSAAGMVNMFPHTAHVESIAVFNLKK